MDDELGDLILRLTPEDGSSVGNGAIMAQIREVHPQLIDETYLIVRDGLVGEGRLAVGRGRGGSIYRPDVTDLKLEATEEPEAKPAAAPRARKGARRGSDGPPQVLSYRHGEMRVNNPEVGMAHAGTDPDGEKTAWAYDPHLDPVLNFDSARAGIERLIDDALASNDPEEMRDALRELKRLQAPYPNWTGKAEGTSFEVDTVSPHVHEPGPQLTACSVQSAPTKAASARSRRRRMRVGRGPSMAARLAAHRPPARPTPGSDILTCAL